MQLLGLSLDGNWIVQMGHLWNSHQIGQTLFDQRLARLLRAHCNQLVLIRVVLLERRQG